MKDKLRRLQAIAIALIIIVSEYMIISAFNHSWYAIGIVFVINLTAVVWVLENILNRTE